MSSASAKEKYFELSEERLRDLRRKPGVRRTFQVGKLWERHKEIARLLLLGYKGTEIAERLGVSTAMVNYTRNSPVVKEQIRAMEGARDASTIDIARDIKMKAPKALEVLEQVLNGEPGTIGELASPALRVKVASEWLDRAGYPSKGASQNLHLHAHFTADEIEDLKRRAKAGGVTIDA